MTDPRADLRRLLGLARRLLIQLKAPVPATEDYAQVRADYEERLFDAFIGAASASRTASFRNAAKRAVVDDVSAAFYSGYVDAGGEDTERDDEAWLTSKQNDELGHLDGVFEWLKEERDAETVTEDAVTARVEAWASTLDSIYNEGLLRGAKNKMLTWHLGDTEQHCSTCLKLNGQRHSAKWFLARDYIPRKPDAAMECGGWKCDCALEDDDGNEVTL